MEPLPVVLPPPERQAPPTDSSSYTPESFTSNVSSFANFVASGGAESVVWDSNLQNCHVCKTEFSFVKRRHHCRCCGRCVCNACSPNRLQLSSTRSRLQRVCSMCIQGVSQPLTSGVFTVHEARSPREGKLKDTVQDLQLQLEAKEQEMKWRQDRLKATETELAYAKDVTFALAKKLQKIATEAESLVNTVKDETRGGPTSPRGVFSPKDVVQPETLEQALGVCETSILPLSECLCLLRQARQNAEMKVDEAKQASDRATQNTAEVVATRKALLDIYHRLCEVSGSELAEEPGTLIDIKEACNIEIDAVESSRKPRETKEELGCPGTPRFAMSAQEEACAKSNEIDVGLAQLASRLHSLAGNANIIEFEGRTPLEVIALCEGVLPALEELAKMKSSMSEDAAEGGNDSRRFSDGISFCATNQDDDDFMTSAPTAHEARKSFHTMSMLDNTHACSVCRSRFGKRYNKTPVNKKVCELCDQSVCEACSLVSTRGGTQYRACKTCVNSSVSETIELQVGKSQRHYTA
eukprot:TRINITY_DN24855_c0_g1_i2.p1 TRINITY_DN24855_c0_g1~~TRINITY_DN24855_c0_g1_i2.p1  ORF type:complete len:524 (-),score=92.48 TRINITY_DN24855_c0_g1_i2:81-1652(-)